MDEKQLEKLKMLRKMFSMPIGKCKQALEQTDWDMDKAKNILASMCDEFAEKKSTVETTDCVAGIYQINGSTYFTKVHCQTDFVAKSPDFGEIVKDILVKYSNNEDYSDRIKHAITIFSSNITVDPIQTLDGHIYYYIHGKTTNYTGPKLCLVKLQNPAHEIGDKIAMHIMGMQPKDIDTLLNQLFILDQSIKVRDLIGENKILEFQYIE